MRVTAGGAAILGRVGGYTRGVDLNAQVLGQELVVRLGTLTAGDDVRLTFTAEGAEGRYGTFTTGQDVRLRHDAGRVQGRVGGVSQSMEFWLELGEVPLPLGALLAVCAYRVWTQQRE